MSRIYVASSWRNELQQSACALLWIADIDDELAAEIVGKEPTP